MLLMFRRSWCLDGRPYSGKAGDLYLTSAALPTLRFGREGIASGGNASHNEDDCNVL